MKKENSLLLFILLGSYLTLPAQTCGTVVGGYIPSYRDPATVDYTKLTHTFYAFAQTNANGDIIVDNPNVFNTFKIASTGTQRFLSVSGGGDNTFAAMAISASARQSFANNCVTFCQTHSLQGIDVDWEGIRSASDSSNYGALMRALASSLHSHGFNLTATIGFGSYSGDYYNTGALKVADWIQLMVYDQTGTWTESPYGNHSSYQHMLDAINYWAQRGYSDLSKIVIGLPFYGYRFNSDQGGLATALSYSDIVNTYPGLSCDRDDVNLTVFNSPETIRKKVRYVIENGLKGVMIWEMGEDLNSSNDRSLLKAISLAACDAPASCNTFFITGISNDESVQFFPIPMHDVLHIAVSQTGQGPCRIELISSIGQRIYYKESTFPNGVETVSVSDFFPGIYYVRITQEDHNPIIKTVIKI